MSEPDYMKYDGRNEEPPYDVCESCRALTAERDEARAQLAQWRSDFSKAMERAKQAETQRDAIIAMLEPGQEPEKQYSTIPHHTDACLLYTRWETRRDLHARAVAIREGREHE